MPKSLVPIHNQMVLDNHEKSMLSAMPCRNLLLKYHYPFTCPITPSYDAYSHSHESCIFPCCYHLYSFIVPAHVKLSHFLEWFHLVVFRERTLHKKRHLKGTVVNPQTQPILFVWDVYVALEVAVSI